MANIQFSSAQESHDHSLETLNHLYNYDDFMLSIDSLCDIGCGINGLDLAWWASRTTRDDENPEPLNIKCTGIDTFSELDLVYRVDNIHYKKYDINSEYTDKETFDVLWCHDTFQYALNPLFTLKQFYNMLNDDGMLVIIIPQLTNVIFNKQEFNQFDYMYHNHTIISLIHMLAVSGFDCNAAFFKKLQDDPWLHCVVYKSTHKPMNPTKTRWFDLIDKELLPKTVVQSINKYGYARQQDLMLPWLNYSNIKYCD